LTSTVWCTKSLYRLDRLLLAISMCKFCTGVQSVMNNRTFFRDNFFEMLCKETNLYYFQNQGKYDSSSKVLKWVDVSVVHAGHKKRVKPGTSASSA
jgi:hypothetical protein